MHVKEGRRVICGLLRGGHGPAPRSQENLGDQRQQRSSRTSHGTGGRQEVDLSASGRPGSPCGKSLSSEAQGRRKATVLCVSRLGHQVAPLW